MTASRERLLERIRAEYLEMPSLCLRLEQAQRLFGLERPLCEMVLDSLVNAKFLCVTKDGAFAQLTDGEYSRPLAAKAHLRPARRLVQAS